MKSLLASSSWSQLTIIGAGPIGLEAASWAAQHQVDFAVFEKRSIGHHLSQFGHIRLFSPFSMNHSHWSPAWLRDSLGVALPEESAYQTAAEYLERYLRPFASLPSIKPHVFTGLRVVGVAREALSKTEHVGKQKRSQYPFRVLLRDRKGNERLHHSWSVLDASGVYSNPRRMGSGNQLALGESELQRIAPEKILYGLTDISGTQKERFAGRSTLLVGCGYSAATSLEAFQELAKAREGTHLYWVHKKPSTQPFTPVEHDPLPYRSRLAHLGNRLADQVPDWLDYYPDSTVQAVSLEGDRLRVTIGAESDPEVLEVDQVLAQVGFRPDPSIYRELEVHECYATEGPMGLAAQLLGSTDCLKTPDQGFETLTNPEPNFFVVGSKSYGTNPTFLLSQGFKQLETILEKLRPTLLDSRSAHLGVS